MPLFLISQPALTAFTVQNRVAFMAGFTGRAGVVAALVLVERHEHSQLLEHFPSRKSIGMLQEDLEHGAEHCTLPSVGNARHGPLPLAPVLCPVA